MKELIILIPGNPSIPGIYDNFLSQVAAELNSTSESVFEILHHLGQCNKRIVKQKKVGVFDVIKDHRESIHKLINFHQAERVVLIGHSLGSAVTIYLHEELKHVVDEFIVLCPFIGPAKSNQRFLRIFQNPISRFGVMSLSRALLVHPKISRAAFRQWLGENPYNDLIPKELQFKGYLNNFFSLVSAYIKDFERLDVRERLTKMDPKKSYFIFAPNDYWVPDEVKNFLPKNAQSVTCEEIQHDFCLSESQCQILSRVIAKRLKLI